MSFKVVVTSGFKKRFKRIFKKYPSLVNDLSALISSLEVKPKQGESLGKGCYKIRMSVTSKRKGKSGGSRVITCVKIENKTVYLLSIFDKSEKESISDKELDTLLKIAGL